MWSGCLPECRLEVFGAAPSLLPEADLHGEPRARRRIIGRYHGIVARQAPFLAILLGRQIVARAQVALERLEFLAVLEADDVVGGDRLLDRDRSRGLAGHGPVTIGDF